MRRKISIAAFAFALTMTSGAPSAAAHGRDLPSAATSRHDASAGIESLAYVHADLVRARTELRLARADDLFTVAPEDEAAQRAHVEHELERARVWLEKALAQVPQDEPQLTAGIRNELAQLDSLAADASAAGASDRFRHMEQRLWRLMSLT